MEFKPFFLVWNASGQNPSFRHATKESAKQEALRLAAANPGIEFFVLTALGKAVKRDIDWHEAQTDDLPF